LYGVYRNLMKDICRKLCSPYLPTVSWAIIGLRQRALGTLYTHAEFQPINVND
jgi:hypothetical protein